MSEPCALCGQPCPFHCRCPECDKPLCDACYERHFEAQCTPAMANPDVCELDDDHQPAESEAQS